MGELPCSRRVPAMDPTWIAFWTRGFLQRRHQIWACGDQTFRQKPSARCGGKVQCLGEMPWVRRATAMRPDAQYLVPSAEKVKFCIRMRKVNLRRRVSVGLSYRHAHRRLRYLFVITDHTECRLGDLYRIAHARLGDNCDVPAQLGRSRQSFIGSQIPVGIEFPPRNFISRADYFSCTFISGCHAGGLRPQQIACCDKVPPTILRVQRVRPMSDGTRTA